MALALDGLRWEALRRAVVQGVADSPLFDMAAYVRQLERAYHTMWELHASGLPPRHFKLVPDERDGRGASADDSSEPELQCEGSGASTA